MMPEKKAAWAAIPTVLEAGTELGPSPSFFPLPRSAGSPDSPFGITPSEAGGGTTGSGLIQC